MTLRILSALLLLIGCRAAFAQCTASAGPNQTITCNNPEVTLQGSSNIPAATYAWSGPGGFTSNQQTPTVVNPGLYMLTITDPSDGCTATASTSVLQNMALPDISVTGGTLTCVQTQVVITGSSLTPGVTFMWTGPSGFQSFQQNPVVSVPGVYTLMVVNPANGCTSFADAVVGQDIVAPNVIASGGAISCSNPNVTLSVSVVPPNSVYQWTGPNSFTSTQQNPTVSWPGVYTVVATNPANGCTATSVVTVAEDGSFPTVTPTVTNVSCNGSFGGIIALTVSGGTPPYMYSWSNGATTQVVNNLAAGVYVVTVTDAATCTRVVSAQVTQATQVAFSPSLIAITNVSCFGQNNGSISLPNPSGGTAPHTYAWSNNSTTKNISNLSAGTYTLTVTDANACTRVFNFQVGGPTAPMTISVVACENTLSATASGGTLPYTSFLWSNLTTTPTITQLQPGTYTITITDANGCSASQTAVLDANSVSCTRITGKILLDDNLNCQADSAESAFAFRYVQAAGSSGTYYGVSNSDGAYTISLLPGDYTVSFVAGNSGAFVCQDSQTVSVPNAGDTGTADFLVQLPDPDCPLLTVSLSTPILRRCFSNNFYYIHYCNEGPVEVPDAYVTLELDPLLSIVSSGNPFSSIGNNTYRFELGTLQPGFCGSIWAQVQVSCNAVLGQTHCSEAHIYPDTICDPVNPQWSGAQVEVKSECAGDSLHFILKNIGSGPMSQLLEYIVIEDGIMLWQGAAPALLPGGEMAVTVPANGATWRIEAEQEPFSPRPEQPVLSVEGCSSSGSFSTGFVNQFAPGDQGQWSDINCMPNVGSYDPNDKQGFPAGYGSSHYIRPGTELEYLIRFQNTGTDTAFTVVIRDTLDGWFDPTTVRPGASSHNYRFEMAGPGILIFDFQNILLPDSNVNEPASHGFVQFRVSPRADVPLETDVTNSAAIYFDFNDPIITNTVQHRIGENFVTVGIWNPRKPEYAVQVAPHPLAEASWLTLSGAPESGDYRLQVFDVNGRTVREITADAPQFLLKKDAMAPGIYLFRVERDRVLVGSGKLVVR